jgi:MFS family permease
LVSPAQRGRAIGVLNISGDLGNAAGPIVAYALLPWMGLSGVYLICAGLYALGSIVTLGFVQARATLGQ